MRRLLLVPVVALTAVVAGCSTTGAASSTSASRSASSSASSSAHPDASRPPAVPVRKLLVVIEENHSLSQMRGGMPYTFSLAQRYGYATDYHALRHPSLPNYLAIAGGQMYGVHDDAAPSAHVIRARSVFGQARAHGVSARAYIDTMTSPCTTENVGRYAVRHNPWTYFVDERAGCRADDRPLTAFAPDVAAGRLPRVGMVTPDLCHDAHDCSLAIADAWFRDLMATVMSGPDWRSGHLAVVLTADEDDHDNQGNVVLTTVVHPSLHHRVVSTPLSHYSLSRLYDEVAGLPPLHHAADAPSMAEAFGLPLS